VTARRPSLAGGGRQSGAASVSRCCRGPASRRVKADRLHPLIPYGGAALRGVRLELLTGAARPSRTICWRVSTGCRSVRVTSRSGRVSKGCSA